MREPKYKIGDDVYSFKDNKIVKEGIRGIILRETRTKPVDFQFMYSSARHLNSKNGGKVEWKFEKNIFPSKQELLDSL